MNLSSLWCRSLPAVVALTTLLAPARAGDERDETTPTGWLWYHSQTFAQVGSIVAKGWRLVDLEYEPGGTYTATFVHNSGPYGRAWWYLIDVDGSALWDFVNKNNARIIDLEARDAGNGVTLFAAVMVHNVGEAGKAWWFYHGTSVAVLGQAATANNARFVDLEEYKISGKTYWAGVMISNTGADARKWWYYVGISGQALGSALSANGARIYDLEMSGSNYNVVMVANPGTYWWYYVGITDQQLLDACTQNGARPISIERDGNTFSVVMINNSNELTTRVGEILRSTTDGSTGVYLKQSNGPVLASLNGGRPFEPASTMKTLHHVHALKQVASSSVSLSTPVTVYTGSTGSCPLDSGPVTEPMETVLRRMMENSDNNRTQAVTARFGQASINGTAASLGMTGTSLNHRLGCVTSNPNRLTLEDAGRLHEAVINGYLGSQRSKFYELMVEGPDSYGSKLATVILQETQAAGLTASQHAAFKAQIKMAYKGGSYTFLGPTREWRSIFGYLSLPFYTSAGIVPKEYVTGVFVDSASVAAKADAAADSAASEVLRDEIRAAVSTWKNYFPGSFVAFGQGCRGSNLQVPYHRATAQVGVGAPNIGTTATYTLEVARQWSPAVLYLGFSRSRWAGNNLPLDLGFAGMPGCTLDVSVDFMLGTATSSSGSVHYPLGLANDRSLIGQHIYTQFAVAEPGVNALGFVHSNALDTMLGGVR